jgi:sugar (pentulose or hexulose) kinase
MEQEVRDAVDLAPTAPLSVIVRIVLESIVDGIARVIDQLSDITSTSMNQVAVVGGGARVPLLHDLLATVPGCLS